MEPPNHAITSGKKYVRMSRFVFHVDVLDALDLCDTSSSVGLVMSGSTSALWSSSMLLRLMP
jgi:hypothetical protein